VYFFFKTDLGVKDFLSRKNRNICTMMREIYEIGFFVLIDAILWRRIELFFLERILGLTAAGVFAFGLQLGDIAWLPIGAILEVWYSKMSETYSRRRDEWKNEWLRKINRFRVIIIFIIFLSVTVVLILLRSPMLKHYSSHTTIILCLVLTRIILNYSGIHSTALYATANQRKLYFPIIIASILKLLANWLLIPKLGLIGSIIAYIISHGYLSIATIFAFNKSIFN
jgi:O-antigen/teichoic acid export membrane protein